MFAHAGEGGGWSRSGGTQDGSYAVDVEVRRGCHASAVLDTIRVGEARLLVGVSTRLTRRRQTAASFQFLPHPNGTIFFYFFVRLLQWDGCTGTCKARHLQLDTSMIP